LSVSGKLTSVRSSSAIVGLMMFSRAEILSSDTEFIEVYVKDFPIVSPLRLWSLRFKFQALAQRRMANYISLFCF